MNIDNDIECKKWLSDKTDYDYLDSELSDMSGFQQKESILLWDKINLNIIMQAVEKINTSSGEYYIEMGQKSWSVYKLLKDKKELAKYCHWIDNNGMLGALKEAIYYIYKESMK